LRNFGGGLSYNKVILPTSRTNTEIATRFRNPIFAQNFRRGRAIWPGLAQTPAKFRKRVLPLLPLHFSRQNFWGGGPAQVPRICYMLFDWVSWEVSEDQFLIHKHTASVDWEVLLLLYLPYTISIPGYIFHSGRRFRRVRRQVMLSVP
jgi:hypothetical protein